MGMKHLPGIDGLRAVAVLAVVAYHYGLVVPVGFVGVDVFFVISGYLITRLLHTELRDTGRIDFVDFYARRARRILPAMALVIGVTLGAAVLILPPVEQQQAMRSGAAAFLFTANVFFDFASAGYFDPAADQQPLLHLWSLAVEEQFYLAWPLVLLLARRKPAVVLATLAVGSFLLAETLDAKAAFYQTHARAWELALGGLVAVHPLRIPKGSTWAGLAVVLASCFVPPAHFPGAGALPAVAGAALLVAAIQNGERNALLESRPLVAVGLISYSLYLWHWPVLVLGERIGIGRAALALLTFALAAASYRYVESPARRQLPRPRWAVCAGVALMLCGGTAAAGRDYQLGMQLSSIANGPSIYSVGCDDWFRSAKVKPCVFGPRDAAHTVVVMGDSVGLQWFPAVVEVFDRPGWRIVALTKSSCPMVDQAFYYPRLQREYTECARWREAALAQVSVMRPDVLILGSTYNYGFTDAQWTAGTERVLDAVAGASKRTVILRATPLLPGNPDHDPAREAAAFRSIAAAAERFPNVSLLDMNESVCPGGACRVKSNGCTIYRDQTHLTMTFARSLAPAFAERLGMRYAGRPYRCDW